MRPPKQLTHGEIARELRRRWDSFPSVETLGSYCQFSQTIHLNSVHLDEFEAAYKSEDIAAKQKVLPLLTHEYQHLIDHVSTVWGRENLVDIFNAYNIRATGRLKDYARVTDLLRKLKTHHYTDYYTEYTDEALIPWDGRPWASRITLGFQIGSDGTERHDRPILFTQFANHDGTYLCRVPFSLSSLLEVNASFQEMVRHLALIEAITDADAKLIDQKQWRDKWLKNLYEPFLTEYSVAAHFVANRYAISNAFEAYQRASLLVSLCLNLPTGLFRHLKLPQSFIESSKIEYNEAFRARFDRGYLFAALVENSSKLPLGAPLGWLEQVLKASELPTVVEIRDAANTAFEDAATGALDGPARGRLNDLLRLGSDLRAAAFQQAESSGGSADSPKPPVLLADNKFITFKGGPRYGTFAEPAEWHRDAFRYYNLMAEFVDACVI